MYEDNVLDFMVENIARLQRGETRAGQPDRLTEDRIMPTREGALTRAATFFDDGGFKSLLSDLVAIPSTAQEEGREADLDRYLNGAIRPWLERLGFTVQVRPNPREGFGPILTGIRIEDAARPTVLLYGHGDTVRGP